MQDIPIKPQIHEKHDAYHYKPQKYLNARKEHNDMESRPASLDLNNTAVNRLYNIKKSSVERLQGIRRGKVDMNDYNSILGQTTKKVLHNKNAS